MDSDFITALGRPFIAHRLRRLSELFVDGYGEWLAAEGVAISPRGLSTLLLLDREGPVGITQIARRLRLSHPLMIKLVGDLEAAGLVRLDRDPKDSRRRPASLTADGRAEVARVQGAVKIIDVAYAELFAEVGVDLPTVIARIETACLGESFRERLDRASRRLSYEKEMLCE